MEFDSVEQFEKIIEEIKPLTAELKIYGIYKNGKIAV
jgi:prephenate dehydratase